MNKLRKEYLLKLINRQVVKVEHAARETSTAARHRYHSESSASVTREYLERLKALHEEVVSSQDKIYSKVQPVSFVGLVYENGEKTELYFVKQPALLPEVLLITPNSPIGAAINGKKMWDNFTYEIEKNEKKISYSGRIVNIE